MASHQIHRGRRRQGLSEPSAGGVIFVGHLVLLCPGDDERLHRFIPIAIPLVLEAEAVQRVFEVAIGVALIWSSVRFGVARGG